MKKKYRASVAKGSRRSNRFGNYSAISGENHGLWKSSLDDALKAGYSMARPGTPAIIKDNQNNEIVSISVKGRKAWKVSNVSLFTLGKRSRVGY